MNIAVLSGKGGTGKTFVSVNLASVVKNARYIDCDVEEPNGHLFFRPEGLSTEEVCVSLPGFDSEKCNGCRRCVDFCRFNALAFIKNVPVRFKDVCHACGGCRLVCSQRAIYERDYPIGRIESGVHKGVTVISGIMNVGEESGVPIIRRLMTRLDSGVNIIDCPPGSACTVMESIEKADYCILVAEPTVFGVHNFLMVYELVRLLKKPFGVVINKDDKDENPMAELCKSRKLPVIMRIGYNPEIADCNARGGIASECMPEVKKRFSELYKRLVSEVRA